MGTAEQPFEYSRTVERIGLTPCQVRTLPLSVMPPYLVRDAFYDPKKASENDSKLLSKLLPEGHPTLKTEW